MSTRDHERPSSPDQPTPSSPHRLKHNREFLHSKLEQAMERDYGEVLSWAICGETSTTEAEDKEMEAKLKKNLYLIEAQAGWNLINPIMIAAEYGNKSKLQLMISLLNPYKVKEVLNQQNSLKNTALHLAASEGHLETVKLLVDKGADIDSKNLYEHTAVMLAIENGQVKVAQWLLRKNPAGLLIKNQYGKNPFFVAAEFAEASEGKILEWILTDFRNEHDAENNPNSQVVDEVINKTAKNGKTPIFFVCKYTKHGAKRGAELVKLMLDCGAKGDYVSVRKVDSGELKVDTCLMWAAKVNNVEAAKVLLALESHRRPDVHFRSTVDGKTALSCAAAAGKLNFVEYLVRYFDEKHHRSGSHYEKMIAFDKRLSMKMAWEEGQIEVATYLMHNLGFDMSQSPRALFDESEIHGMQKTFIKPEHGETLKVLARTAAEHNFHFEIFLTLIPCYASPSSELNKQLPIFYDHLQLQADKKDVDLVYILVRLLAAIQTAAQKHQMQKLDLQLRINAIKEMLKECIASDCMDDASTVQKMLCCAVRWRKDKRFQTSTVERAQAFISGPLVTSLSNNISALFCTGHVATFVDSVFYGSLRRPHASHSSGLGASTSLNSFTHRLLNSLDKEVGHLKLLKSRFIYFRFCPAMMFLGEALCRLWMFVVVALVALQLRKDMYAFIERKSHATTIERMLVGLLCSNLLYEYGQLCHNTTSIFPSPRRVRMHLQQGWSQCNLVGLFLVALWAAFTFFPLGKSVSARAYVALGCLATSTVLFATGLLRYLSILEPVGKLVIMIIAMLQELAAFALVFFVSCVGYCIALYCIMPQAAGFTSFGGSILTLFAASLGNFDSTYDDLAIRSPFVTLTLIIVVVFVIVSNVVLLNLIIARMSAVHERIDEHSFQEWQLLRAVRTQRFLLLEESHPFCMLPPPFNLVPTAFFLIHRGHIQRKRAKLTAKTIQLSPVITDDKIFCSTHSLPSGSSKSNGPVWDIWSRLCFCWGINASIMPTSSFRVDVGTVSAFDGSSSTKHPEGEQPREAMGSLSQDQQAELDKLSTSLSICGTATDVFAGVLMAFVAPWIEMMGAIRTKVRSSYSFYTSVRDVVFTIVVFICVYLPFVVSLVYEALHTYTVVKLVLDDVNPSKCQAMYVRYHEEARYARIKSDNAVTKSSSTANPGHLANASDSHIKVPKERTIAVRVIKSFGLDSITGVPPRNPIIRIRLGHIEAVITDSVRQEDGSDLWTHKKILFPIDFGRLVSDPSYKLTMSVVDFDSSTSEEVELGTFSNNDNTGSSEDGDNSTAGDLNRSMSGFIFKSARFSVQDLKSSSSKTAAIVKQSQPKVKPASATNGMYDAFSIRECIANKKFEGKLRLDNTNASVQVVIEAQVQRTLQELLSLSRDSSFHSQWDSRMLVTSQSFTETKCEEDDSFDVDIFSPTDRLRIFHKSDVVRKLVNQRSADMAVTPLGGANHGSCSAKGKDTPAEHATHTVAALIDTDQPIAFVKEHHQPPMHKGFSSLKLQTGESNRRLVDSEGKSEGNSAKVTWHREHSNHHNREHIGTATENTAAGAGNSSTVITGRMRPHSPVKLPHISTDHDGGSLATTPHPNPSKVNNNTAALEEELAQRDKELKMSKDRLTQVMSANAKLMAEKDKKIAQLEKLVEQLLVKRTV